MAAMNSIFALSALNLFLSDVRDGLGPFLGVFLQEKNWTPAEIGLVMTIGGLAGMVATVPMGALVDASRAKRAIVVIGSIVVILASVAILLAPQFGVVAVAQALNSIAAAALGPAVAGLTLGLVGPSGFDRQLGRNEAFNHAGNATAATLAGISAYFFGPVAVFWLMAAMAVASIFSTLAVPADAIDHHVARGLDVSSRDDKPDRDQPSGFQVLLTCRPLLVFAACVVLFHFANAAMLPLVGQKLALVNRDLGTSLMSVCIVAAQLVMVPVAMIVGRKADVWGHKPIFAVALAVLALRGMLYPLSDNPYWLVGVQTLDGVGAGIFGALFPLVVSDLTRGTGHFNVSQGAIATAAGLGGALSTAAAGLIVVHAGYSAAFLVLAGISGLGLVLFLTMMPATRTA